MIRSRNYWLPKSHHNRHADVSVYSSVTLLRLVVPRTRDRYEVNIFFPKSLVVFALTESPHDFLAVSRRKSTRNWIALVCRQIPNRSLSFLELRFNNALWLYRMKVAGAMSGHTSWWGCEGISEFQGSLKWFAQRRLARNYYVRWSNPSWLSRWLRDLHAANTSRARFSELAITCRCAQVIIWSQAYFSNGCSAEKAIASTGHDRSLAISKAWKLCKQPLIATLGACVSLSYQTQ